MRHIIIYVTSQITIKARGDFVLNRIYAGRVIMYSTYINPSVSKSHIIILRRCFEKIRAIDALLDYHPHHIISLDSWRIQHAGGID